MALYRLISLHVTAPTRQVDSHTIFIAELTFITVEVDIATRRGLKVVHANFPAYYQKLNAVYVTAERRKNEKVLGGVVAVCAKMCADAILRDKLLGEGLLEKVIPLLRFDSTRHVALEALATITHHGGVHARVQIARYNSVLVKLIQDYGDDVKVLELAIVTMSHSTNAILGVTERPDPGLVNAIAVQSVLETTMAAVCDARASYCLIDHGVGLLTCATEHCPADTEAVHGLLSLLVAFLSSSNICTRCSALAALIRYTASKSAMTREYYDPAKLMVAVSRQIPDNLNEVMSRYGPDRCDILVTLQTTFQYKEAMGRCFYDHDLVALGRSLARLIQRTEYSVVEGFYQVQTLSGHSPDVALGLDEPPFTRWTDALPLCAKALRSLGTCADVEMADIIDLKHMIIRERITEAVSMARKVVARSPNLAYAYYALSLDGDHGDGLRAAKKGLRCTNITPFVRLYLLWRAVEHAGNLGVMMLQSTSASSSEFSIGSAFLMSAWEDAKTFVSLAPPDNRHMQTILNWYIALQFAVRGHEIVRTLSEMKEALHKLGISSQILRFLDNPIPRTQMHLARELMVSLYPSSTERWSTVVRRVDGLYANYTRTPISNDEADDNLAAWLNNTKDGEGEGVAPYPCTPQATVTNYMLYRCSWCANPSAVLRKCRDCKDARYCDRQCQKEHWKEHRKACKQVAAA